MSKIKTKITQNPDGTGYDYFYELDGKTFFPDKIKTHDIINGAAKTRTYIDSDTGEILDIRTSNIVSDNNSKIYLHSNCFDIAKDKNIPREKIKSDNEHIIDLNKKYSNYLQVSTGSSHDKRGIIVADVDIDTQKNTDKSEIEQYVINTLNDKFELIDLLNLPKPTSFQIHLTNGHVQLFWVIEKEITIKKRKYKTVDDDGALRKLYYFENTQNWTKYMRCMRFFAMLFEGDPAFTGWQIKNMFLNDPIFKNSFKTFWLNNNTFTEAEPVELVKYDFDKLHDTVYSFFSNPESAKHKLLKSLISKSFISLNMLESLIHGDLMLSESVKSKYGIKPEHKKIDIREGRNQYVRMKTYETIRAYKNNINIDDCRKIVKRAFRNALKKDGTLPGTKNYKTYTEDDFEKDFYGAYMHATMTYNKPTGYTDRQRELSKTQRKLIKNKRHEILLSILELHPELIPDNKKNCVRIRQLFKELENVDIKSNNTVSNYKKELGIKSTQKKLSPKNYKLADKYYSERIDKQHELENAYDKLDKISMPDQVKNKWVKRINNIKCVSVNKIFKSRKRLTLKLHKITVKRIIKTTINGLTESQYCKIKDSLSPIYKIYNEQIINPIDTVKRL